MGMTRGPIEAAVDAKVAALRMARLPLQGDDLKAFAMDVAMVQEMLWAWAKAEVKPKGVGLRALVAAMVTLTATIHAYAVEDADSAGEIAFKLLELIDAIRAEREEGA